jgi:hypothetical protein
MIAGMATTGLRVCNCNVTACNCSYGDSGTAVVTIGPTHPGPSKAEVEQLAAEAFREFVDAEIEDSIEGGWQQVANETRTRHYERPEITPRIRGPPDGCCFLRLARLFIR